MKKVVLNFLVIAALTVSAALTSCEEEVKVKAPELTTTEVTEFTENTAKSGGNITDDGGAEVTTRGVCWGTSANPTISGNKTSDGTGKGSFTSTLSGLEPSTEYFVRAYATNSAGTSYGNEVSFTTFAEPEKVKLVETITYENYGNSAKYEYDNQSRISKISWYGGTHLERSTTLTYNSNDLVKVAHWDGYDNSTRTEEYVKNGNKITMTRKYENPVDNDICTINLNSDGTIAKFEINGSDYFTTYQYKDGNLTKYSDYKAGEFEYKYDNKKSPFFNCKTPKWYMFFYFDCDDVFAGVNNMIERSWSGEWADEYTYVYDEDGFPTKLTEKSTRYDGEMVIKFKYK